MARDERQNPDSTDPERQSLERTDADSGEDAAYVHHRAPKVDAYDDVDDEDGAMEEELTAENDLTLHVTPRPDELAADVADDASLGEPADEVDDLAREDRGAVNIEKDDVERTENM
ncbi:MAG TPA: hypothetical protein VFS40_05930 [Gemmatimonadales bacterium]|nr:hypothetical protein [Gemmatimonadales bacterium]